MRPPVVAEPIEGLEKPVEARAVEDVLLLPLDLFDVPGGRPRGRAPGLAWFGGMTARKVLVRIETGLTVNGFLLIAFGCLKYHVAW